MKKIFTLCFMVCICSTVSYAQVKLGVKGGGNLSFLRYDPDIDFDNQSSFGFHLGGFAHFTVADNFGVQVEALYTTLGGRSEGEINDGGFIANVEVTDNINYISVPVMFKYTSPSGFTAEIGPAISFLVKAEETAEVSGGGQNLSTDTDIKDILKSTDFMIGVGLGYELPSGLSFGGRFSLGLSNIFDEDVVDPDVQELRNAVFQLSVGFPVFGS